MALTSISVQTGVVVHGRALARNGAVTLDNDVFTAPSCIGSTASQAPATTVAGATVAAVDTIAPADTTFNVTDITLPRTGSKSVSTASLAGAAMLLVGAAALMIARRRRVAA